jgi:two-component system sensor histidine kinase HydH
MPAKRSSYLPITSIVVGIIMVALVVGFTSFRDIERGRRQVEDVLSRQARLAIGSLGGAFRASLLAPDWDRTRLDLMLQQAAEHEEIAHIGIVDVDGTIVSHSDPERVGTIWAGREVLLAAPEDRRMASIVSEEDGRNVHEYASLLRALPRRGPRFRPPSLFRIQAEEIIHERLRSLLSTPVPPGAPVDLFMVVGLDASELEAAFLASRNHTFMMSGILLLVGGIAIYFLFLMAHYRSVRTALANMRSYTTNVIESMGSGLVSVDSDARVVTVNTRARSLLGLARDDVEGKAFDEVVTFDADGDRAGVHGVMGGADDTFETEARIGGRGDAIPVALAASSLTDEDGERSGTVVLFQDLREMEALKEEVERERHLASLGRLAAGVAHEVRNPLSSLKGFAQFLRSKFTPGSQEERYADIMIEEVERLDRVVQELLDFAKPVAPDRRPSDVNDVVGEVISLVSEDAQFRKVELAAALGSELPDALVDPGQIKQAVLNVILNAIEAMSGGGRLSVETKIAGGEVAVSVSDTGAGMTDEELGKLYDPFFTTKPEGTGLGLTIVSRIVERNGGHISVSSAKGEGTTFTIRLPSAGAPKEA